MSKALVIVESPAKVRTISKFLGRDYIVKSSVGHIRDLAKKTPTPKSKAKDADPPRRKLIERLGVDPEHNWQAAYEIVPGKEKVLKALKDAAAEVDHIFLATDLDREGEAIAWHLQQAIGGAQSRYKRVTFTEITRQAVLDAFA